MVVWAISLVLFVLVMYIALLCRNRSLTLSVGLCFLIEMVWAIISCAYLDYGEAFILETGKTSYHTGALFRMLVLYAPMMFMLGRRKSGKIANVYYERVVFVQMSAVNAARIILYCTLFVVLYCLLDMLLAGIPLFSAAIGRQNYSAYSKLPLISKINGEVTYFGILVAGMAFFYDRNKNNKKLALLCFVLCVVHRLLMEYKYHGMYNIIFMFFLPTLYAWYEKRKYRILSLKTVMRITGMVCIVLILCYYTYTLNNTSFNALELLFDRIFALQSHAFWGLDKVQWVDQFELWGNAKDLVYEIEAVLQAKGQMDRNSGIVNVMYKVANSIAVEANLDKGVRWAGSYLTVGINTVGYLGTAFISLLLGEVIVFDFKMFISSLHNREYVTLFFSQSLMWDLLDYFRIGNWSIILNIKTIITVTVLLFLFIVKSKSARTYSRVGGRVMHE